MSLWINWWNAIWRLRPAFSRLQNLPPVRHRRGRLHRAHRHAGRDQHRERTEPRCSLLQYPHQWLPQLPVEARPAHRAVDPAGAKAVKDYIQSTKGRLTLHCLPGYAPALNPDEQAWSRVKRTRMARASSRAGEPWRDKIEAYCCTADSLILSRPECRLYYRRVSSPHRGTPNASCQAIRQ